jgi:MFS transporter, DHA3 family, macrolide efflux protein
MSSTPPVPPRSLVRDPRMRTFLALWTGQLLSMVGSALTGFGMSVWIYQRTGSATQFAMNSLFMVVTGLVVGQVSGAIADRWNRKRMLLCSDLGMAANTIAIATLLLLGRLEVWHIYVVTVSGAVFNSFRWPAMNGIIVQITPREHLSRANGMMFAGETTASIIAPLLAGTLMVLVGLPGILIIDAVSFVAFVAILLAIRIPAVRQPARERQRKSSLFADIAEGWAFVYRRPGLVGLLVFSALANFLFGVVEVLFTPLVLGAGSVALLGWASTIAAAGMLAGGLVMSVWGGARRRVRFYFAMVGLQGALAIVVGIQPIMPLIMAGAAGYMFVFPLLAGTQQALWQTRVPHHMQGRISAVRNTVSSAALPLALVLAGPLADRVFKPLLVAGGTLDGTAIARVLGTGPDRGIGLLFVVMGALSIAAAGLAYLYPRIRHVEDELPVVIDEPGRSTRRASPQPARTTSPPSTSPPSHSTTSPSRPPSLPAPRSQIAP